ncbi:hypothetical protein PLICRDRAFT_38423 [Plicaturopsis crispa FD-325 SS-3]|nr:hypothetical protein PLICRDRAFT_38423 [Plicaturopsis crispa FD-325 SS-3]
MTRTERAIFPRAMVKDRHESRTGLDKHLRKNGGGPHNWGALADEGDLESAAYEDEEEELRAERARRVDSAGEDIDEKPVHVRRSSSLTDAERASAKSFRKNTFKGQGVDLAAIARTSSAVSTSPPTRTLSIGTDADSVVSA